MYSLQELCLNLTVKHFDRYFFAFNESKDASMQRNLHFLKRRFSDLLATELLGYDENTDTYFDFLINEHLTDVDFDWFRNSRYLKSIDDIFRRLPNLIKIDFSFCGNEILESLAKFCPDIVEIIIFDRNVRDEGIKHLCGTKDGKPPCPKLKNVHFHGITGVTDEGAEYLIRSLPSIENFSYPELPLLLHSIYVRNLSEPQKIHFNFTRLNLIKYVMFNPHSAEILKACLTVCPKLEYIECKLTRKEELKEMTNIQLKKLKDLTLFFFEEGTNIDDFIIANGRNLIRLNMTKCTVSASVLATNCLSLKEIEVNDVELTDADDLKLLFPSLTECRLSHRNSTIDKAFCLFSSSSPNLENVLLSQSGRLSRELKSQIINWCTTRIKNIKFFFCSIDLEISFLIDLILNCQSLKMITFYLCVYDVRKPGNILNALIKNLPNKPQISCFDTDFMDSVDLASMDFDLFKEI